MTVYMWVRVGNGQPEPAAITGEKPNRQAVTIGCPDPFNVDQKNSPCKIVMVVNHNYKRPSLHYRRDDNINGRAREYAITCKADDGWTLAEVTPEEAAKREAAYKREIKITPHSYAGFGRTPQ